MEKKKLFFIMISITSIIFLLVLIGVIVVLRSGNTTNSEPVVTEPAYSVPTPFSGAIPTKSQELITDEEYKDFPFKLATAVPEEFSTKIKNNSSEGSSSFEITYSSIADSFVMNISTLETQPESVQTERVKFIPPLYNYDPADFVTIATINGQQLLVSKTGAIDVVVENEIGTLKAAPDLVARTENGSNEYYIYQLYNGKLSEYISAFNDSERNVANYDNSFIVTYFINDEVDKSKWTSYQSLIRESLQSIQKSLN